MTPFYRDSLENPQFGVSKVQAFQGQVRFDPPYPGLQTVALHSVALRFPRFRAIALHPLRSSGFSDKRALDQKTCFRAWYEVRFLRRLCILGGLVYGEGAPLVRYLCATWESPHMFFTKRCPSGGTKYVSFELFLGILR